MITFGHALFDVFVDQVYFGWGFFVDEYFGLDEFYAFLLEYLGVDVEVLQQEAEEIGFVDV